ncbi:HET-domain-containing protein [Pleomassaria siparia CBS 279.74]|uniref:HET-domain-containing protein n=1 Tax=Pleomassaria siparia CBS 279.74 TaxID=1314801 RepID=A0A6G1K2T3_9PLEO|nr:HET-domain-containing protein [Pleomassaria siparia CBS 279.74]
MADLEIRASRFCSKCGQIFQKPLSHLIVPRSARHPHRLHTTITELKYAGLVEKCYICYRAWIRMQEFDYDEYRDRKIHMTLRLREEDSVLRPREFRLVVRWSLEQTECSVAFCIKPLDEKYMIPEPASRSDLIQQWVSGCTSSHENCGKGHARESYVPSRLMLIGPSGHLWNLHVIATDGPTLDDKYIALSYQWGQHNQFRLLSSNMDQLRSGLPISDLPKTFRDTIEVARVLSVQYIWIDALCIMQDSPEDWRIESVRMRDVYANSYCTVAASWAADPTWGLFHERKVEDYRPTIVKTKWTSEVHADLETLSLFEDDAWNKQVTRSPLHKRGWALQERFLSPRILYFTMVQMLWECDSSRKCELFPDKSPREYSYPGIRPERLHTWFSPLASDDYRRGIVKRTSSEIAKSKRDDTHKFYNAWVNVIGTYSSCNITMAKDKLVAVGGLAEQFQELSGDDFLAGLWRSQIFTGLTWRVVNSLDSKAKLKEYRAPTWSWASVEGLISMLRCANKSTLVIHPFQMLDVQVVTDSASGSPRGQILSAHIALRGHAPAYRSFKYSPNSISSALNNDIEDMFRIKVTLDYHPTPRTRTFSEEPEVFLLLLEFGFDPKQPLVAHEGVGQGIIVQKTLALGNEYLRIGHFRSGAWTHRHLALFGLKSHGSGSVVVDDERELQTFWIL